MVRLSNELRKEETGAPITIEETEGIGKYVVLHLTKDSIDAALGKIKAIVAVQKIGEVRRNSAFYHAIRFAS